MFTAAAVASAIRARCCAADKAGECMVLCICEDAERERILSMRFIYRELGAANTCCPTTPDGNSNLRCDESVSLAADESTAVLSGELIVASLLAFECVGDAIVMYTNEYTLLETRTACLIA